MALRGAAEGLSARERNIEFALLAGGAGFVVLAWRALEAAEFELPGGSARIVAQFLLTGLLGHAGLRLTAPRSAAQPYATAILLAAVGLAFVTRLAPDLAQDQCNWISLGVVLMVAAAGMSRWFPLLRASTYTAALAAIVLLVLTGLFGETINGARLWISIAGQSFQTTEAIKLFMLLFVAGYLASEAEVLASSRIRFAGRTYGALPYLVPLGLAVFATMAALALLKDLGSIALLLLVAVGMLYLATGRRRFIAGGVALLAVTGLAGYVMFGHVEARVDTWLDPFADPGGSGYQATQSLYAIQAGGVMGEGLGLGQPGVIPAAPTDYIFSAIAEELGLAGALGVVMLFLVFMFSGLRAAVGVADEYGRLLAAGVALLIGIQAAVIIAGNLQLVPTTGITLPFVSYGGSSLVVNFMLLGLLLGVSHAGRRQP